MREMRRKDREITDEAKIDEIISRCNCCRIGFNDSGEVYIVPLNFGYVKQDGRRTFYFHSAKDGRKIDLVKEGYEVGFERTAATSCTRVSPPATATLNSAVLSAMETFR